MTNKITRDDYLKALGLYTLARHHAEKQVEFAEALLKHLKIEDGGHFSDAIYNCPSDVTFDEALEREGILVEGGAS